MTTDVPEERADKFCFDELGCIVTDFSWFNLFKRPFNWKPFDRHHINTSFTLYTRASSQVYSMVVAPL